MKLSVVTTVYKSEKYLDEFINQIINTIKAISISEFELIFVLDGITDNSMDCLLKWKKECKEINIVELSRNFGHHYAIFAGLDYASGELTFLIDCDLEVHPKTLVNFYNTILESDIDVVYGIQKNRKGSLINKHLGNLFWKIFNILSEIKVPKNVLTERLMKRDYLDSLLSLKEKNLFFAGNMYWVGYKQQALEINKTKRNSRSTYDFLRRFNLLIEAITSFSDKPLKILFYFGLIITSISSMAIFVQLLKKISSPTYVLPGFTTIYILILIVLGILLTSLGLVSIYLSKVFKETKSRPLYVVKKIIK